MNFEINNMISDIEGWLSKKEADLLYNLAKNCKGKGVIVEIGSWKGKSTLCLGMGSKHGKKINVYAIDPHTGATDHKKMGKVWTFNDFKKNIIKVKSKGLIKPLVKTSKKAAKDFKKPVELIFIDGEHEYSGVKLDFNLWFNKVINGGIMAFHDTVRWSGPRRLVSEKIFKSRRFKNVKFIDSITYAVKVKKNSLIDCLRNRFNLLIKDLYSLGLRLKSYLPKPIRRLLKKIAFKIQ